VCRYTKCPVSDNRKAVCAMMKTRTRGVRHTPYANTFTESESVNGDAIRSIASLMYHRKLSEAYNVKMFLFVVTRLWVAPEVLIHQ